MASDIRKARITSPTPNLAAFSAFSEENVSASVLKGAYALIQLRRDALAVPAAPIFSRSPTRGNRGRDAKHIRSATALQGLQNGNEKPLPQLNAGESTSQLQWPSPVLAPAPHSPAPPPAVDGAGNQLPQMQASLLSAYLTSIAVRQQADATFLSISLDINPPIQLQRAPFLAQGFLNQTATPTAFAAPQAGYADQNESQRLRETALPKTLGTRNVPNLMIDSRVHTGGVQKVAQRPSRNRLATGSPDNNHKPLQVSEIDDLPIKRSTRLVRARSTRSASEDTEDRKVRTKNLAKSKKGGKVHPTGPRALRAVGPGATQIPSYTEDSVGANWHNITTVHTSLKNDFPAHLAEFEKTILNLRRPFPEAGPGVVPLEVWKSNNAFRKHREYLAVLTERLVWVENQLEEAGIGYGWNTNVQPQTEEYFRAVSLKYLRDRLKQRKRISEICLAKKGARGGLKEELVY